MNEVEAKRTRERKLVEIHVKIEEGDIDSVQRLVQDEMPGQALCSHSHSALERSFIYNQPEISAFLVNFGLTLEDHEARKPRICEEDVDLINLLWYFLQKKEKATSDELSTFSYIILANHGISIAKDSSEWLKNVLENKDDYIYRVLHLAAKRNVCLEDTLQFCDDNFQREKVIEMLLSCDKDGDTLVHSMARNNIPKVMMKNLTSLREHLAEDSLFKMLLKIKGRNSSNLFHYISFRKRDLENMITLCNAHLGKVEIEEMLLSYNEVGENVIDVIFRESEYWNIGKNLSAITPFFRNDTQLMRLQEGTKIRVREIFHTSCLRGLFFADLLRFCEKFVEKDEIKELLIRTNDDGDNVIHSMILEGHDDCGYNVSEILQVVHEILGDDKEWFKQLLKSKGYFSRNIFHEAAITDMFFEDLLRFCDAHLEKDEIQEMLLSADEEGVNVIYNLISHVGYGTLDRKFSTIKEVLGNDQMFKQILQRKGEKSWNILHLCLTYDLFFGPWIIFCESHLGKANVKEMMLWTDDDGDNVMHCLLRCANVRYIIDDLDDIREVGDDEEWFKILLKSKGGNLRNIFQTFGPKDCLKKLLKYCGNHLRQEEIKEMLLDPDEFGDNIIHYLINEVDTDYTISLLKHISKTFADNDFLKQFLKSKGRNFLNIFHLASKEDTYFLGLVKFCATYFEIAEITDMVFAPEINGHNALHLLLEKNSTESLLEALNALKDILGNDQRFQQLLWSKGIILDDTSLSGMNFENLSVRENEEADILMEFEESERK